MLMNLKKSKNYDEFEKNFENLDKYEKISKIFMNLKKQIHHNFWI